MADTREAALERVADVMARYEVDIRQVDLSRFTPDELLRLRVMVDERRERKA